MPESWTGQLATDADANSVEVEFETDSEGLAIYKSEGRKVTFRFILHRLLVVQDENADLELQDSGEPRYRAEFTILVTSEQAEDELSEVPE